MVELPPDPRYVPVPRFRAEGQPKIALALSGGGAKGLAHIGVLEGLEARGVMPDAVTGTSVGAVVGSFYAAGYAPADIENIFTGRDWNPIYGTLNINHGALSEREELRERAPLFTLHLKDGHIVHPRAFFKGGEMEEALNRLLFHAQTASGGEFDRLMIPLRVVSADTGCSTSCSPVFAPARGPLARLVRASISIPGVFEPVDHEGHTLVDGMVVSNIPTQQAAELQPDLIFASDVTTPFYPEKKGKGIITQLGRVVDVMLAEQQRHSRSLAALVLRPDVKNLPQADLHAEVLKAVALGREAVSAAERDLYDRLDERAKTPAFEVERVILDGPADSAAQLLSEELRGRPTVLRVSLALARLRSHAGLRDVRAAYSPAAKTLTIRFTAEPELRDVSLRVDGQPVAWQNPGGRFSWALARRVIGMIRTRYTDAGFAAFNVHDSAWRPESGTLSIAATSGVIGDVAYAMDRSASEKVAQKRLDLQPGAKLNVDEMAENLGELKGRGVLESWTATPAPAASSTPAAAVVDLKLSGKSAEGLKLRFGGSYRDELNGQGFAQLLWLNPSGRGDRLDLLLVKGTDSDRVEGGYHQEYLWGARHPVGFDFRGAAFADNFPLIGNGIRLDAKRPFRGWRATLGAFYRTPATGYIGFDIGAESIGTPEFRGAPRGSGDRQFVSLSYDYDRRDRLFVPTAGTYLRARVDSSVSGLDFHRQEIELGHSRLIWPRTSGTLSGRLALGASEGNPPFYAQFNPGGWRDNYGFMDYGLAAPNYALFSGTYRQALFDLGPLQLYGELGATGARTALTFGNLRNVDTRFGGGLSLIAINNLIGPVTLGYQLNNESGHAAFILVGVPLEWRY